MQLLDQNGHKPKSFWERPEGTTGMIAIGLLGLGAVFVVAPLLTTLFNTLASMFTAAIAMTFFGAVLFGLIMILTNKKFQNLISYMFKSAMRKITGAFVEIDPIGIMKSYIEDLFKKRQTMQDSIDKLSGQERTCANQVRANENEYRNQMAMVQEATKQGKSGAATVAARQAGRIEKNNNEIYKPLLLQIQLLSKALRKYHEVTGVVIDDLKNEVQSQEMSRKVMAEAHSAMSVAKSILQGSGEGKELYDHALEFTIEDYGMKLGEIESFIESSKSFVEGIDLQNGVYEAQALEKLKQWEESADQILLGTTKGRSMTDYHMNSPIKTGVGVPAAGQDYSKFF